MSKVDIDKLSDRAFALFFARLHEKILEDPYNNFVRAPAFINFTPSPTQAVIFKCFFGQELDSVTKHTVRLEDLTDREEFKLLEAEMTETEIYKFSTGFDYEFEPGVVKNRINLILGRRSGKTISSAILALYSAIRMNWKPYLTKTPAAAVVLLSQSVEFSTESVLLLKNLLQDSPILKRLIDVKSRNRQMLFNLKIPFVEDGKIVYSKVIIKVAAASTKSTRGLAVCTLLTDEISSWNTDEKAAERDVDILRAARPALLQFKQFGFMIKLSSPRIKSGILYDEYRKWQENKLPNNYIVFKGPTWFWNPILDEAEIREEFLIDQESFDSEIRANFVDSISNFISVEALEACVIQGISFRTPSDSKKETQKFFAAIDAAFKGDRFTFSICGHEDGKMVQYISKGWSGTPYKPVKVAEVVKFIRETGKIFPFNSVLADQYAFQPLREIFSEQGVVLEQENFTTALKKKIYWNLKRFINNRDIELLDNPIQTNELKQLVVEQAKTGNIKVGHPQGGSDDFADSLALAVWSAAQNAGNLYADFESTLSSSSSADKIKTDINGTPFVAPDAEMLGNHLGIHVDSNADFFYKDPDTGKLIPYEDDDDDVSFFI